MYSLDIPFVPFPKYFGVFLQSNCSTSSEVFRTSHGPSIYKCLIRSCMEYALSLILQSSHNVEMLQGIQYQALRIIYKAPLMTSIKELHSKANIVTLDSRLKQLNNNYLNSALNSENPLLEVFE